MLSYLPYERGMQFLSTPSVRRATPESEAEVIANVISIHALREEGDGGVTTAIQEVTISIHALREEGDSRTVPNFAYSSISIHALREEGDML